MRYKQFWRFALILLFVFILAATALTSYREEDKLCMGVPVVTEAELSRFVSVQSQDISGALSFEGYNAAVDRETFTVYISQNVDVSTRYDNLEGILAAENPQLKLYFIEDEMFNDMESAVKNRHRFRLVVNNSDEEYTEYGVIFTTFPVIRLEGSVLYKTADMQSEYGGEVTLWDADYVGTGAMVAENSSVQWHNDDVRVKKKNDRNLKLSAVTKDGDSKSIDIMGLGEDDDWLLNSLSADDSKVRKNLATQLWNNMNTNMSANTLVMPDGNYAEVIYNGEYKGVYFVSRKTDRKHLNLDSNDLLLRDKKLRRGSYTKNNYTFLHGYYTEEEVWNMVTPFHTKQDCSMINIDSWIDANLYTNLVWNKGDRDYAEMYYIWYNAGSDGNLYLLPVMENCIFGITSDREDYKFSKKLSSAKIQLREEYNCIKAVYPDIDSRIKERYIQLRNTVWTADAISGIIDSCTLPLIKSGVVSESEILSEAEQLKDYIKARLEYLDGVFIV